MITLNDDQMKLKYALLKWYNGYGSGKPYFYYSGAAGTGKTTVIKTLINELGLNDNQYAACAYVGKAVLALLRNGLNASTIHSLIYRMEFVSKREIDYDEYGNPIKKFKKRMEFVRKPSLDKNIKLIFVDECGMVNDTMLDDIFSYGIPVVLCGDHNQLPPVFGESSILSYPDYTLTQLVRQAETDPIVYIGQCILNDVPLRYGRYGNSFIVPSIKFDKRLLTDYDMILCAKNKTREEINDTVRYQLLDLSDRKPVLNDKVICRKNNWNYDVNGIYLTNGLIGTITNISYASIHRDLIYIDFKPDFMDKEFEKLTIDYEFIRSDWKTRRDMGYPRDGVDRFEYAYAITTHLAQGSEADRVLFIDENFGDADTLKRLQYTAITRAKKSITFVMKERKSTYSF